MTAASGADDDTCARCGRLDGVHARWCEHRVTCVDRTPASGADQPTLRDRYWQCDDTCTVDCGACKGQGRPTLRDQLAEALCNDAEDESAAWDFADDHERDYWRQKAERLFLPFVTEHVERVKAEAAAEALEDAADDCEAHGSSWRQVLARDATPFTYARWLRTRAAALRSNAGGDRS